MQRFHEYYILNEDHVALGVDVLTWARWMEEHDEERIVARTPVGPFEVSTVFLGFDHSLGLRGEPRQLFETMVFSVEPRQTRHGYLRECHYEFTRRYATWEQAMCGHEDVVGHLREQQTPLWPEARR